MPETNVESVPARQAALSGLAVVGFIALIALGLYLAVSAARFVPGVVNGLGSAAVYLGSVFTPGGSDTNAITVGTSTPSEIATTTTTISFGTPASSTPAETTPAPARRTNPRTAGNSTSGVFPIGSTTPASPTLSGLPDLVARIDGVGYLATSSADSFVASSTVPAGSRPAVRFTITNVGTNMTGSWRFSASIPTTSGYIFQSDLQQSLAPGDSIQYTLGFDQPRTGLQTVSVTANSDHAVNESNANNNSAAANLTIYGS